MAQATGLFQYCDNGEAICQECVIETMKSNPGMRLSDWTDATIGDFDTESCDTCDCVPAAEGKALVIVPDGRAMFNELQAHRIARDTAALYANAGLVYDVAAFKAVKEIALAEVSK